MSRRPSHRRRPHPRPRLPPLRRAAAPASAAPSAPSSSTAMQRALGPAPAASGPRSCRSLAVIIAYVPGHRVRGRRRAVPDDATARRRACCPTYGDYYGFIIRRDHAVRRASWPPRCCAPTAAPACSALYLAVAARPATPTWLAKAVARRRGLLAIVTPRPAAADARGLHARRAPGPTGPATSLAPARRGGRRPALVVDAAVHRAVAWRCRASPTGKAVASAGDHPAAPGCTAVDRPRSSSGADAARPSSFCLDLLELALRARAPASTATSAERRAHHVGRASPACTRLDRCLASADRCCRRLTGGCRYRRLTVATDAGTRRDPRR